jgi:hypothetical protein
LSEAVRAAHCPIHSFLQAAKALRTVAGVCAFLIFALAGSAAYAVGAL